MMSEAIWIELIKVLPAFLWVIFGFIVLAVAKRLFTAQAPRMTKVETPWVTVELAQMAIEQAAVRGPVEAPPIEPDWSQLYPPLPSQQVGSGFGPPGGADDDAWGFLDPDAEDEPSAGLESGNSAGRLVPIVSQPEKANSQNTPPAHGPSDNSVTQADERSDDLPPSPVTEPNLQVPNVPPTYPILVAPPGNAGGYYAPPIPSRQTSYAASAPPPPYGQATAFRQSAPADTQRGLRSATRLALSADLLQGGAILWVDDHQQWNEPLIRLFRTAGITVDAVASTDEAMRAFKDRSYDLVITDMRRELEPDGDMAGMLLLDRMIAAGIPTPAVFFSDHPNAHTAVHPRAVTTTNSPETLVDTVVDIVGTRRSQQTSNSGTSWIDRLKG